MIRCCFLLLVVLLFIAGGVVVVVVVDSLHLYVMCYGHFVIENDVLLCFYYSLESVICLEICVQIFIFMKLQLILICLSRKQLTVSKNKICNPHVEVVNYFNHFYTILKISTFLSWHSLEIREIFHFISLTSLEIHNIFSQFTPTS